MDPGEDFTADDFLFALNCQNRLETIAVANKIFSFLDVEKTGKLGIDEVKFGFVLLAKKLKDKFGVELLSSNINPAQTLEIIDEDDDGFITVDDVYKYMRRRNRIMSKGFSLMDVKLSRNSGEESVVRMSLTKIFRALDTKKLGKIDAS
jgi:Ca2+-binding EF-hand superfamily protein